MIHPLVKLITIDEFYSEEQATNLFNGVANLQYEQTEFGKEIPEFNLVSSDSNKLFSDVLNTNIIVDESRSGFFRYPELFIHFEPFDNLNEWVFAVALRHSTFNVYENHRGPKNAREGHELGYKNLFEWDLTINYILKAGQGVLFRPWLFHSFDTGLIQTFRLREDNGN